jgi:hypothetical protein
MDKIITFVKTMPIMPSKATIATIALMFFTLNAIPVIKAAQSYNGNVQMLASALPANVLSTPKTNHPKPQHKPKVR